MPQLMNMIKVKVVVFVIIIMIIFWDQQQITKIDAESKKII